MYAHRICIRYVTSDEVFIFKGKRDLPSHKINIITRDGYFK